MYGKSHNVTSQNRINCYLEPQPGDDRSRVAVYGTPGKDLEGSFGDTPIRGIYQRTDFLYVVHRGTFYEVNNAGVKTDKGTIGTTSGRVYMADNGKQLMMTDGTNGYIYTFDLSVKAITSISNVTTTATLTTSSAHGLASGMTITVSGATPALYNGTFVITVTGLNTFTYTMAGDPGGVATIVGAYTVNQLQQITDADYPGAAFVTWQDGYFIVNQPNTQRFYISEIQNGFMWDALDFASAEANPDNLTACVSDNSNLYLFGPITTEFWSNSGALDFPFSRISGGAVEWGCAAVNSICKYDNTLMFLAKNRMGEVIVARMNGYSPYRVSNPELEYIINNYPAVSDATAISYMIGGHPMYQINFPTGDASWLYDGLSNAWTKLESYGLNRDIGQIGVNFFDKIVVTDYANGNYYRLNPETFTENGQPLTFEIISKHLSINNERFIIDALQLDMETGVGIETGQGDNPQIMLSISKDYGHTFGTEQWIPIGKVGQYRSRAIWRRLGQARDWVFKFRITDPVKRVIYGASLNIRKGTS